MGEYTRARDAMARTPSGSGSREHLPRLHGLRLLVDDSDVDISELQASLDGLVGLVGVESAEAECEGLTSSNRREENKEQVHGAKHVVQCVLELLAALGVAGCAGEAVEARLHRRHSEDADHGLNQRAEAKAAAATVAPADTPQGIPVVSVDSASGKQEGTAYAQGGANDGRQHDGQASHSAVLLEATLLPKLLADGGHRRRLDGIPDDVHQVAEEDENDDADVRVQELLRQARHAAIEDFNAKHRGHGRCTPLADRGAHSRRGH
mmetsp:Transcript_101328/g.325631  ORF Transcript_101328/g.325631 Transcript_101328/m.325631 type:complete len:265 (+) Transcript_101328:64-858(+)